jgi:hypothetical protein
VAVGVIVAVAVGSTVFVVVGVGAGCEVAQAIETEINKKINDIKVDKGLRSIFPP